MSLKFASLIALVVIVVSISPAAFKALTFADSLSISSISPRAGPPGTLIYVFVVGATADDGSVRLKIYFNDVNVFNLTESSSYSEWGCGVRVPDVEPGEYTVKALDVFSNTTATAMFVVTLAPSPPKVGAKAGDWIKYDYTITGWSAGTPYPKWLKVEFLSVEQATATVRVTMHMSNETEQNATVSVDVVAGGEALGLSGFIIPANWTITYSINMGSAGFTFPVTIAGETTRTYAGTVRTVVYASFSQYGTYFTYYWDKQTGVMVEASTTSGTMTGTGKATETNMWQPSPSFPIDPTILSVLIAIVILIVIAIFLVRRKKKPTEAQGSEK